MWSLEDYDSAIYLILKAAGITDDEQRHRQRQASTLIAHSHMKGVEPEQAAIAIARELFGVAIIPEAGAPRAASG